MVTRREPFQAVCHWCKIDIDPDTNLARTPLENFEPVGSVGWPVCGPSCPDRPEGAKVYEKKARVKVSI